MFQASADKIRDEIAKYGNPPKFPEPPKEELKEEEKEEDKKEEEKKEEKKEESKGQKQEKKGKQEKQGKKGKQGKQEVKKEEKDKKEDKMKKKGKVAAKSTGKMFQWQIMESMGVPVEEIPSFASTDKWLTYFPTYTIVNIFFFWIFVSNSLFACRRT